MAATGVALILSALMVVAFATLFSTSLMRGIREASYMATPLAVPQAFAVIGSIQFSLALTARLIRLALRLPAETEPADPDAIHHA